MADATREEAIAWCIENNCDFKNPVYPPPEGWMWAQCAEGLILTALFTGTEDADITALDTGAHQKPGAA